MNIKHRIKILNKIAQTKSVSGSPRSFNIATAYPTTTLGLGSKNIPALVKLGDLLNNALYYSSNGEKDLQWMKSINFNADTSGAMSVDLKNIILFCNLLYHNLMTNLGVDFKQQLSTDDIANRVRLLSTSQPLTSLSSTNTTSQLNSKIGGNLKTLILDALTQIK